MTLPTQKPVMSYASVASHNVPPPSMQVNNVVVSSKTELTQRLAPQPHPDPSLNTTRGTASNVIDDTGNKVNTVEPGFKEHPAVHLVPLTSRVFPLLTKSHRPKHR